MFNISKIQGKLIVSCQPEADEGFYNLEFIQGMVQAAVLAEAGGLRLNHPDTIAAVKAQTNLPIIGIWKQIHSGSNVYITPTLESAMSLLAAGSDIIALDGTLRTRPNEDLQTLLTGLLKQDVCLMADISTLEEGIQAEAMGFHCVGTTLSGYTPYSVQSEGPDFNLLSALVERLKIPVIMEGKVWQPEQARMALKQGAHAVVVGSAITRPQVIAKRFIQAMQF